MGTTDHISINDFYHVYAYACLYTSLKKGNIHDLSITFIGSRYPRDLLKHLREERGYAIEKKFPGVYVVSGDVFPIQIIDSRKLSAEENIWLNSLYNKLEMPEMRYVIDETQRYDKDARIEVYLGAITEANTRIFKEVMKMRASLIARNKVVEELSEEFGFTERWKAEGQAKAQLEIARNFKKAGLPINQIAEGTGLSPETVEKL